ncbi:MAG: YdeI/OmpD-associated family protein, partial [Isosphaeraceae bacterium]|nr:YdeI/OmpD-associated family protein [Isosphaeraceae bacterium]
RAPKFSLPDLAGNIHELQSMRGSFLLLNFWATTAPLSLEQLRLLHRHSAALAARPAALQFYRTLNSANRYAILYRIQDAKRPETRAARIAKFAAMLDRGEKIYP